MVCLLFYCEYCKEGRRLQWARSCVIQLQRKGAYSYIALVIFMVNLIVVSDKMVPPPPCSIYNIQYTNVFWRGGGHGATQKGFLAI